MKLRPMLQVRDVPAASRWYQATLGLRSGHGGDEFEMLFDADDDVLRLHRLDAHEHGILQPGADQPVGLGASFWFELRDQEAVESLIERARSSGTSVAENPHWNPNARHHEATLIDPDGYVVVVHSPFEPG